MHFITAKLFHCFYAQFLMTVLLAKHLWTIGEKQKGGNMKRTDNTKNESPSLHERTVNRQFWEVGYNYIFIFRICFYFVVVCDLTKVRCSSDVLKKLYNCISGNNCTFEREYPSWYEFVIVLTNEVVLSIFFRGFNMCANLMAKKNKHRIFFADNKEENNDDGIFWRVSNN